MDVIATSTAPSSPQTTDTSSVLPGHLFSSTQVYETERDKIFADGWISVGLGQQLPNPGDIRPVTIAGFPLLLIRDKNSQIQVFHNVCRHRGAALVNEPCNHKRGMISCPYHQWSYKLDGSFLRAPYFYGDDEDQSMPDEEKEKLGLLKVRFEVWWDIIFVNISGEAQPFADFIAPLADKLHNFDDTQLRLVNTTDFSTQANWKLAADNFLDGYHVPFVHPQACDMSAALGQQEELLSSDIMGLLLPEGAAAKPKTKRPMPMFPNLSAGEKIRQQWYCLFPNTLFFVDPRWVQVINLRPDAVDHCDETLAYYAIGDEAMSDSFAIERLGVDKILQEVNQQDIDFLDQLQTPRSSDAADHGHLSPAWDKVGLAFQQSWQQKMEAHS